VVSYCPRLSLTRMVPSAPQRYPGSWRNCAIPAHSGNSGGRLQNSDEANMDTKSHGAR